MKPDNETNEVETSFRRWFKKRPFKVDKPAPPNIEEAIRKLYEESSRRDFIQRKFLGFLVRYCKDNECTMYQAADGFAKQTTSKKTDRQHVHTELVTVIKHYERLVLDKALSPRRRAR